MNDFLLSKYKPCQKQQDNAWLATDFQDYISRNITAIRECRTDLTETNKSLIIDTNAPFELNSTKTKVGILLLHGLLDSPYGMRDLAAVFAAQGYLVRAALIPGHGTRPGDLLNICLDDWLASTHFAIEQSLQQVEQLFVVGFSGGASLALLHALNYPNIAGIITLAPSLRLLNKAARLSGLVHAYGSYRNKHHWFSRDAYYDYARYEAFPANLAVLASKLAKLTRKQLQINTLPQPWLTILTEDDETICSKTVYELFNKTTCTANRLLMYAHKMPKETIPDRVEYRISRDLHHQILDYSHISLPIAPGNTRYGIHGTQENQILFTEKSRYGETVFKGAISSKNKATHNLQRLTYNPDFDYMANKILHFIQALID